MSVGTGSDQEAELLKPCVIFSVTLDRFILFISRPDLCWHRSGKIIPESIIQEIKLICVQQPTMVTPRETSLSLLVT